MKLPDSLMVAAFDPKLSRYIVLGPRNLSSSTELAAADAGCIVVPRPRVPLGIVAGHRCRRRHRAVPYRAGRTTPEAAAGDLPDPWHRPADGPAVARCSRSRRTAHVLARQAAVTMANFCDAVADALNEGKDLTIVLANTWTLEDAAEINLHDDEAANAAMAGA